MKKLSMCRICLAENVRLFEVVHKSLQELYQKLTDIPFITEDSRPVLACSFCCTKLKQCFRLMRKCLEAEELFAQMMNEDYEPKSSINSDLFECFSGLVKTEIQIISIVDVDQTENIVVKEELPAVCEIRGDVIETKEEHQRYDIKEEVVDIVDSDGEENLSSQRNIGEEPEDDVQLMEYKIEIGEETRVSEQKQSPVVETCYIKQEDLRSGVLDREEEILPTQHIFKIELEEEPVLPELEERAVENYWSADGQEPELHYRRTKVGDSIHADKQKNRHKCDVCHLNFTKRVLLTRHLLTHVSEKPYKCDVCQRSFGTKTYLKKHMIIHAGKKSYKCDICQRSFTQSGHLSGHLRTHTGEKPYKCDVCQTCFAKKGNLNHHIRIHHSELNPENKSVGKPFQCEICQISFRTRCDLNRHTRIHTGEKPYKCDICQRGFIQKPHLTSHIRTHTGERPYKCFYCDRCFRDSGDLKKHVRVHTGEKPYKCDVCHRGFNQRTHLTNHIRTHTLKNLRNGFLPEQVITFIQANDDILLDS